MKINFVQTIIAIAVSALIAYGLYSFHNGENKILLSAGSFVFLSVSLILSIGVNFEQSRTSTNIRVLSGIFFAIALISNLIFNFLSFSEATYIITNGILFLIYILIVYSINSAKQQPTLSIQAHLHVAPATTKTKTCKRACLPKRTNRKTMQQKSRRKY